MLPLFSSLYPDEVKHLLASKRHDILGTNTEHSVIQVTRPTACLFKLPIVLVSMVDDQCQWLKSCDEIDLLKMNRNISSCDPVSASEELTLIAENLRLATLCAFGPAPHTEFTAAQRTPDMIRPPGS